MTPEPIQKFIDSFSRLPSIGPRLATRLAFY
ncbi:MAG: recombination protein RecR, partial [Patescibacteria group bacterium]